MSDQYPKFYLAKWSDARRRFFTHATAHDVGHAAIRAARKPGRYRVVKLTADRVVPLRPFDVRGAA